MKRSSSHLLLAVAIAAASPALSQEADWAGFYGGLSFSTHDGDNAYDIDGDRPYPLEGSMRGGMAGYLWTRGSLVFGGELVFNRGVVHEVDPFTGVSYEEEYQFDSFVDLKGRVGYALNDFLLYGTMGLSKSSFTYSFTETAEQTGLVYGIGADYRIGDRYFVGAEYLRRSYEMDLVTDRVDSSIESFALRLGLSF